MLRTAITSGPHVLLTWFYDVCDGSHAKKRVSEHLTPHPYPRLVPGRYKMVQRERQCVHQFVHPHVGRSVSVGLCMLLLQYCTR